MVSNSNTEVINQLDAICDEFEREILASIEAGKKPTQLNRWLKRVEPELRPWLRCELIAIYRELNPKPVERAARPSEDVPLGVDPAIWRAIKHNRTFRPLSLDAKESLAKAIRPRRFDAGSSLLISGQRAKGLYLLLDGEVEIVVVDGGKRSTIDIDGRGSVMGEISTITGEPCTADVIAITEVTALELPADRFDTIRVRHPEIEIALSQLVSDRLGQQSRDALCGKTLGGYRLQRCISTGAMGVVYAAKRESDRSPVALKMLRHRFIYHPQVVSRFEREAELLQSLQHPNIVSFQDHFIAYKTRFIVLDLYDGTDLRQFLRDQGPVNEATAKGVLGQIAEGLQHAHQCGVLHLDLKPANILINRQGHTAITDFGLSKLIESDGCESEAVGTPLYMPPEQFTMTNVGVHSDWYALGCIAYELITGERLFSAHDDLELFDVKQQTPNSRWPVVESSKEYRRLICRAIHPTADKRTMDLESIARWARDVPELAPPMDTLFG